MRGRRFAPVIVLARILESALAQARGDLAGAEKLLREALALAEERQARYSAGRVHLALADVAQGRGDRAAITSHLADAHARFVATGAPAWARRAEDAARVAGVTLPAPA